MRRLDELAWFSGKPGSLTRLFLTPEHKAAAMQVAAWMREAGMTAGLDATGNVVGRCEAEAGALALLLGSHIHTVRNAGKYDGNLGVIAAIEAVTCRRRLAPLWSPSRAGGRGGQTGPGKSVAPRLRH